jgi:hypothetical protein
MPRGEFARGVLSAAFARSADQATPADQARTSDYENTSDAGGGGDLVVVHRDGV